MSQGVITTSANAEETRAFGAELAVSAKPGMVVALDGPLGAGKTHFIQGLVKALGHESPVTSPTFILVHEYSGGRLTVYHLDFYRLNSAEEVTDLGWDEFLDAGGIVVVEWASKFPELLPAGLTTWIDIRVPEPGSPEELANPDARTIVYRGVGG